MPEEPVDPEDERPTAGPDTESGDELPADVVDEAVRLTRHARRATTDSERAACLDERRALLAAHGFRARVRDDAVLTLYPAEWLDEGTVDLGAVDDIDRGIERTLEGSGDDREWETIDAHNRALVEAVREAHGPDHGANAAALADFMSNHYSKRIEMATRAELQLFLSEYYPRNAWPTDDQKAVVRESVRLVFEQTEVSVPLES